MRYTTDNQTYETFCKLYLAHPITASSVSEGYTPYSGVLLDDGFIIICFKKVPESRLFRVNPIMGDVEQCIITGRVSVIIQCLVLLKNLADRSKR